MRVSGSVSRIMSTQAQNSRFLSAVPLGSQVVPFWGLPYRILSMNHKKELPGSLWAPKT